MSEPAILSFKSLFLKFQPLVSFNDLVHGPQTIHFFSWSDMSVIFLSALAALYLPFGGTVRKNGITDACSTADCCPLLTICPRCCPRHAPDDVIIHCGYHRLPLDGAVIGTFEYCSVCSDWTTVVFWGNSLVKLIIANVSQCFPYNIQQFPNVLQKYSLKQNN